MSGAAEARVGSATADPVLDNLIDEFAKRVQAGQPVDLEAFARQHPERADELRRLLPAMQVLAELVRSAGEGPRSGAAPRPGLDPALGELGDFRIAREVGRGGMGVVYEAVQISLGRRVALKVLPFAAALDPKQLQRFKNEAQAAARLQHPNIVAVYGVGCERGVHYYAMQFIDGETLAAVIGELRQLAGAAGMPSTASAAGAGSTPRHPEAHAAETGARHLPRSETAAAETAPRLSGRLGTERSTRTPAFCRTVARLGVQAAEALEHAHQQGVVHRDIKPANLLVDGRGRLWVTDFGLAHFQGQAGLTMTGDLLGTVRYMSPEQALTRPDLVDHRTDLYSLGATLYELLTLRPPIPGRERQELLARLSLEEPVPPRRLNPAVPADLETILLKALAKEPAERYPTAQELADDLRRFLEDRPIQARRPTFAQRTAKWARRHRRLVAWSVGLLVLAVVGLAVSTALIWREKELKEEAYRREAKQRQEAEAKWQYARQAVDQMYLEAEEWMVHGAQQERLQQFLRKALKFYEEFARDRSADPAARLAACRAYQRVGEIQSRLGRFGPAEKAYRQAIALLEGLEEGTLAKPDNQFALAQSESALFQLYCTTSRLRDADKAIRRSLDIGTRLAEAFPRSAEYRVHQVGCHCCLAELHLVTGRPREAREAFLRTLDLLNQLPADFPRVPFHAVSARVHDSLGYWFGATGRYAEAEQAFGRARDSLKQLVDLSPAKPRHRLELARAHHHLGFALLGAGRFPQAARACREAIALQEKLAREFPAVPGHRGDLADYHITLGNALRRAGQLDRAEAAYGRAVSLLEKFTADFPDAPDYRMQLTVSQANLAKLYWDTRRPKQAGPAFRRALDLCSRLVKDFPERPEYRNHLGRTYRAFGRFLMSTRRLKEAEDALRQSLAIYVKLAADFPPRRTEFIPFHPGAADPKEPAGEVPATFRPRLPGPVDPRSPDLRRRLEADPVPLADFRTQVAVCHNNLGVVLTAAGAFAKAEPEYRQARDLFAKLAAGSPDFPHYRFQLVFCCRNLASVLGKGRLREREQILTRGLAVQDKLVTEFPEDPLSRGQWAATLADLALTLRARGKPADARQLVARADSRRLALKAIPPDPDVRLQVQNDYLRLARACLGLERHRECARAAAEVGRLATDRWNNVFLAADLLARCIPLAEHDAALSAAGRRARAGAYADQARALFAAALERGKDDPRCQDVLAWTWANCPARQLREPRRALALARQAVQGAPRQASYWTTLGVACYRTGDWKGAAAAAEESLRLEGRGNSYDWFVLAMARWRLGARDEARRWYDRAVGAMKDDPRGIQELRRFRDEAAGLMGLK
jgi:serine/threonine protein kinase/tetratricopeptide (TPR) repeat protein